MQIQGHIIIVTISVSRHSGSLGLRVDTQALCVAQSSSPCIVFVHPPVCTCGVLYTHICSPDLSTQYGPFKSQHTTLYPNWNRASRTALHVDVRWGGLIFSTFLKLTLLHCNPSSRSCLFWKLLLKFVFTLWTVQR